jgi:hypothetical protein
MIDLIAAARRAFRRSARSARPVADLGMWESSTCATLRRHWIEPLDRE